jgi:hypothetical protein
MSCVSALIPLPRGRPLTPRPVLRALTDEALLDVDDIRHLGVAGHAATWDGEEGRFQQQIGRSQRLRRLPAAAARQKSRSSWRASPRGGGCGTCSRPNHYAAGRRQATSTHQDADDDPERGAAGNGGGPRRLATRRAVRLRTLLRVAIKGENGPPVSRRRVCRGRRLWECC